MSLFENVVVKNGLVGEIKEEVKKDLEEETKNGRKYFFMIVGEKKSFIIYHH